jgi:hypothetical protein
MRLHAALLLVLAACASAPVPHPSAPQRPPQAGPVDKVLDPAHTGRGHGTAG